MKSISAFRKNHPVILRLIVATLIGVSTLLLFEWQNGSHPECMINTSVGPCDYWGRVATTLPFIVYPIVCCWALLVFAHQLRKMSLKKLSNKSRVQINTMIVGFICVWLLAYPLSFLTSWTILAGLFWVYAYVGWIPPLFLWIQNRKVRTKK